MAKQRGFGSLTRRQLDAKLKRAREIQPLVGDDFTWVKTIRQALGMSAAQLGKRMGISRQGIADLERREKTGSVTVGNLRKAAQALNCDLAITFVPKTPLETTVRLQAERKTMDERNRIVHTMRLEDQQEGLDLAGDTDSAVQAWLNERFNKLWD